VIATLPVGYHPVVTTIGQLLANVGTAGVTVTITTAGAIAIQTATGSASYAFNSFTFRAEN
jgi:hypothetical protein